MDFANGRGMGFCSKCGAQLAPDDRFCSRCGTAVAAAHAAPKRGPAIAVPPRTAAGAPRKPASRDPRGRWWLAPAIVVALVLVAWLAIVGLPFGGEEEPLVRNDTTPTDTIAEGTAPPGSSLDVGGQAPPAANSTDFGFEVTEAPPPLILPENQAPPPGYPPATATVPPPMTSGAPPVPQRPAPVPAPRQTPPPVREPERREPDRPREPEREPEPERAQLSESQAAASLRRYIDARDYYGGVRGNCLQIRSSGYRNVGYGFSVWDACVGGGVSRRLGVWRVDAKNGDVFLQGPSGRYGRP